MSWACLWPHLRFTAAPQLHAGLRLSASPAFLGFPRAAGGLRGERPSPGWLLLGTPRSPWLCGSRTRCPGLRHPAAVVAWHLVLCYGCGRQRASLACLLAPRWSAAPRLVRLLSVLRSAFPSPWCLPPTRGLSPPALLGGCAGHAQAGRQAGALCLPLAPAEAGTLGLLGVIAIRGPAMGLSLAGPSGFGPGLRALRWFGVCGPGHWRVQFPVPSVVRRGTRPVHRGCFVWTPTPPLSGRRTPRPGPMRLCVCPLFLAGLGRPASWARFGAPHRSFGRFVLLLCSAPSGLGLPLLRFFVFFSPLPALSLSPAFCAVPFVFRPPLFLSPPPHSPPRPFPLLCFISLFFSFVCFGFFLTRRGGLGGASLLLRACLGLLAPAAVCPLGLLLCRACADVGALGCVALVPRGVVLLRGAQCMPCLFAVLRCLPWCVPGWCPPTLPLFLVLCGRLCALVLLCRVCAPSCLCPPWLCSVLLRVCVVLPLLVSCDAPAWCAVS